MSSGKIKRLLLQIVLAIYAVEVVWFLFSSVVKPLIAGSPIDIGTVELAFVLVIGLIAIITFILLKRSKKIGVIVVGLIVGSALIFSILAPLLDAYLPLIWKIFK